MSINTGSVAWIFGDCYDIDLICGVKNIAVTDDETLATLAMQDYDPGFAARVKPGDILCAGVAFGYGHPHPQGMKAMRKFGITTIIAKSFARVFFKNEVSSGMTLLPCAQLPDDLKLGETLNVDLDAWTITRAADACVYALDSIPPVEKEMIKCKGIANYLQSSAK